jgi:hypothetical protein
MFPGMLPKAYKHYQKSITAQGTTFKEKTQGYLLLCNKQTPATF